MAHRSNVKKEMAVYKKLGIRGIAIHVVNFITWVRQYGFRTGFLIFRSLLKSKKGSYRIKTDYFKNPVLLRDNYSDKAIFNQVFFQRQYALDRLKSFQAKYIIDAGANVGLASIYFAQLYPESNIMAIEPQVDNYKLLQENVRGYTNVSCLQAALWYKEESIDIQNPDSLAASFMVEAKPDSLIKGLTIDSLLNQNNWTTVDILKMDIEGAEKEIFSHETVWLNKVRLLIIELHDNYKDDCTKTFFKAIEGYNYEAVFRDENIFIFFKQ
jgi:FkbM family methyltransferase